MAICRSIPWSLATLPLVLLLACDQRPALLPADFKLTSDATATDDLWVADATAPVTCKALKQVSSIMLGPQQSYPTVPAVAHDGQGNLGIIWVDRKDSVDADGILRFARVDLRQGKLVTAKEGIPLGITRQYPAPQLVWQGSEFGVMHAIYLHGKTQLQLLRIDGQGSKKGTVVIGKHDGFALARHSGGYAVLYHQDPGLTYATVTPSGSIQSTAVTTDKVKWPHLWLAPRTGGGFAAAWDDRLALLESNGALVAPPASTTPRNEGFQYYVHTGAGFGLLYLGGRALDLVFQRLSPTGSPVGQPVTLGPANLSAAPYNQFRLVWTGGSYIALQNGFGGKGPSLLVLDETGNKVAESEASSCFASTVFGDAAVWTGDRLAVATTGYGSGVPWGFVCLKTYECQ